MTKVIRLTEADLNKIIKKVITEQKYSSLSDAINDPNAKGFTTNSSNVAKSKTNLMGGTAKDAFNKSEPEHSISSEGFGNSTVNNTFNKKTERPIQKLITDPLLRKKVDVTGKTTKFNPDPHKDTTTFKPSFPKTEPKVQPKQSIYKQTNPLSNPIQQGARGPQVKEIQNQLLTLGYQLNADGDFGPLTKGKVVAFQQANGLKLTGIVDNETGGLLSKQASVKKTMDGVTKSPFPQTDKTPFSLNRPKEKVVPMPKTNPTYHVPNDFGSSKPTTSTKTPTQTKVPPMLDKNNYNKGYDPKNPLGI